MAESRPQMEPGGFQGSMIGGSGEVNSPSQMPPAGAQQEEVSASQGMSVKGISDMAPSLPLTSAIAAGVSAWQNSMKLNALWSINQNRNSWVGVEGIGWKKLANNSDSAIVALTMLASHARAKGSSVNYREESDGMIYEMYVW
jgi:hypothetical protein